MQRVTCITREKLTVLADERLQEIVRQLNDFFLNSTQSSDILYAIFEQYYPSSSIYESIIYLYSISLYKPTICKLLDRIIEYLNLNNDENLYKFNDQTDHCNLLHNSIIKNYENIFQLLLKCGFNPNSLLSNNKTPLSISVVTNNIHPTKRLEYIQLLIAYGANAITIDDANVSPFKRLCGLESNYPIVYTFYRDYLLSVYPDEVQFELNAGLKNALYNWCVPIVTDLLEHGAIFHALKNVDAFIHFLTQMSSTIFKERRSISFIDPFILCLIEILLYNLPCENYSICIEKFIEFIYIPTVCFEANNDPLNHPSMKIFKKFLYLCFHYGYLNKRIAIEIQTRHLPRILTSPIQNSLVPQTTRQCLVDILNKYFNELIIKYHKNPISLKLLSIRIIRQSMNKINQNNLEQLNINSHLKNTILLRN